MGKLTKTENTIKVDIDDIVPLYRFVGGMLSLSEEYTKDYRNEYLDCRGDSCSIRISPNFILLPRVRYSDIPFDMQMLIRIERKNEINLENLSHFDIYSFECDGPFGKIASLDLVVEFPSDGGGIVHANGIKTGFSGYKYLPGRNLATSYESFIEFYVHNYYYGLEKLEQSVNSVKNVIGESYFELVAKKSPVVDSISLVENSMVNILNLLYVLYHSNFDRSLVGIEEYRSLVNLVDVLKRLGNNFEEALLGAKEVSHLVSLL
jgi:hypothetical protein